LSPGGEGYDATFDPEALHSNGAFSKRDSSVKMPFSENLKYVDD